jgi:WD40 repeat protein
VTPNRRFALTGGDDRTAVLWDLTVPARPVRRGTLAGHAGAVSAVAFAPDGHTALTGGRDGTAILYDVTERDSPRTLGYLTIPDERDPDMVPDRDIVSAVAFSPDGYTALIGNFNRTAALWDVRDSTRPVLLATLSGHTGAVSAVALAPDYRTALTASFDATARLWDVHDNPTRPALLATLAPDAGPVSAAAFSPDGSTAITGSHDGTTILWDVTDPRHPSRLLTLAGHAGPVTAVAASSDGRTVLTAGADQTVVMWDVSQARDVLAHPLAYACAIAKGGLDPQEWQRYVTGLPYRDTCPR